MLMTKLNPRVSALAVSLLLSVGCLSVLAQPATDEMKLNAGTFGHLHKQIRPQPGESRWMDVPWLTDLHEARRLAAAEGKPLFLMASGKASSIGMC